ncbi:MAG: aconitase X catalytic domain-containing protein [Candidatus Verstraetearchaeota archaeon]|nr:aconitase X catalytic domain-containing protein [Candidatus Verstraetearchaeota archaeon]
MELDREEERMLKGEEGPAVRKAMELLVAVGEVMGAGRMVKIKSAQVSGVSYGNIGEAGLEFLEDWAENGAKVKVLTTLNPCGMDLERWVEMGIDERYRSKQMSIIEAFRKMGAETTCTCTPYLAGNLPKRGDHIAWSESSAVCYANSVIGARTNREGGPSALAAAIAGRTPFYGLHLEENRAPTVIVEVQTYVRTSYEFSLLGYTVGKIIGAGIPFFKGLRAAESDKLKIMSAALAASGGIAMFHIPGVTPEAESYDKACLERICVDLTELERSRDYLSYGNEADLCCVGCPHCSLNELEELSILLRGRKVSSGKGLWVWTSKVVRDEAKRRGYIKAIEDAGGKVFVDTCMVVCPLERSGFAYMVTNSCKAAHYVPSTSGLKASVAELSEAVEMVLEGR